MSKVINVMNQTNGSYKSREERDFFNKWLLIFKEDVHATNQIQPRVPILDQGGINPSPPKFVL